MPEPTTEALPTTWSVPTSLLRSRRVGGDALLAYLALWQIAGCRPARLTIRFVGLALALGSSERSARRWVRVLAAAGLLHVVDRSPGCVLVELRAPRAVTRDPPAGQRQMVLGDLTEIDEPEPQIIRIYAQTTARRSDHADYTPAG